MFTLVPTAMAEGDEAPAGGEPTPVETHAVKTTKTGDVTYSADDAKIEKYQNFIKFYNLYKSLLKEGYTKDEILIIIGKVLNRNND